MLFCSVTRIHCFIYLGFCHRQDQVRTKYTVLNLGKTMQTAAWHRTAEHLTSELHLRHWPCFHTALLYFCQIYPRYQSTDPNGTVSSINFVPLVTEGFVVKVGWAGAEQMDSQTSKQQCPSHPPGQHLCPRNTRMLRDNTAIERQHLHRMGLQ